MGGKGRGRDLPAQCQSASYTPEKTVHDNNSIPNNWIYMF